MTTTLDTTAFSTEASLMTRPLRRLRTGLDAGRLVELDMAFLGPRVVTAEFAVGVGGPVALGSLSMVQVWRGGFHGVTWSLAFGLELIAIGLNYVPLFLHALQLGKDVEGIGALKRTMRGNPREARSYSYRQAWILVPGAVFAFELWQSRNAGRPRWS